MNDIIDLTDTLTNRRLEQRDTAEAVFQAVCAFLRDEQNITAQDIVCSLLETAQTVADAHLQTDPQFLARSIHQLLGYIPPPDDA